MTNIVFSNRNVVILSTGDSSFIFCHVMSADNSVLNCLTIAHQQW